MSRHRFVSVITVAPAGVLVSCAPKALVAPPMEVGSTFRCFDGSLLVAVPGGSFIRGNDGKDSPARTLTVDPIWMRQGNKSEVGVNWQQADDYCTSINERLPAEAEWEKTSRGPDRNTYPWAEDAPACGPFNFDGCLRKAAFVWLCPDGESYYFSRIGLKVKVL